MSWRRTDPGERSAALWTASAVPAWLVRSLIGRGAPRPGRFRPGPVALAVALCLLGGCVIVDFQDGQPIPEARLFRIEAGVTTKAEVLEWFGAPVGFSDSTALETLLGNYELLPDDVLDLPFADALVFRFTQGRIRASYFLVYLSARLDLRSDTLVVFFDDQDRVLYYGYTDGTSEGDEEAAATRSAESD